MRSELALWEPETAVAPPGSADLHPVAVYLARLRPGSRRAMRQALDTIAAILTGGQFNADGPFWPALRYQHTAAIRAALAERYRPATANKMLAAPCAACCRSAGRLGLMSAEEYQRAWDLKTIKAETLLRGRALTLVHGRNHKIRASMFHFLRELGLEPLEWGDLVEATGNPTPSILEVLRAGFEIAQAAVVLFTPEDEARLRSDFCADDDAVHERELPPQPRLNVIFEAGMVMAHFPPPHGYRADRPYPGRLRTSQGFISSSSTTPWMPAANSGADSGWPSVTSKHLRQRPDGKARGTSTCDGRSGSSSAAHALFHMRTRSSSSNLFSLRPIA